MKRLIVYLNGLRGMNVLEELLKHNYRNLIIFSGNHFKELDKYKANNHLKIFYNKRINTNSHYDKIKKFNPHLSIVAGYSQIFNKRLIELPKFGTINMHAGPLPKYRGGSPLNWQIINGERYIGVSLIKMAEGIDEGLILKKSRFFLKEDDDIATVHKKANTMFAKLLITLLKEIFNNKEKPVKQIEKHAQYWHQRSELDGKINWSLMKSDQVHNLVRALTKPYNGAYTYLNSQKIIIYKSKIPKKKFCGTPGRVVKIKNNNLLVICADYGLYIEDYKFQNSNKKLLNGMHLN